MREYKIGIIGYGGFGKFLHNAWKQLENVLVCGVADQNFDQMHGLNDIKTFTDWRDLLTESEIDLIAIVTEPASHEMIATACMQAGKHVLIEKPLAITLDAATTIIQVRDSTKTVAAIDFIMRFNPLLETIQRFTALGIFGTLRRVDVENYAQDEQLKPTHWFWDRERSGGILIEHAVHFIDLVHFISPSKPLMVNGLKHNRNPQQEDQIMANVLYEDGLIATHYHAFSRPGFFETTNIRLTYDLADIELHGWIPLEAEIKVLVGAETKAHLSSSPFFTQRHSTPIENAFDESRPAGWGKSDSTDNAEASRSTIRSGGIEYHVDEVVSGTLKLGRSKQEVYSSCVQASLLDVLRKIEDDSHILRAPLETGLSSLEVAVKATESARDRV